jgi:hypothetical protein
MTNEAGISSAKAHAHHFTKSRDGLTVIALSTCALPVSFNSWAVTRIGRPPLEA